MKYGFTKTLGGLSVLESSGQDLLWMCREMSIPQWLQSTKTPAIRIPGRSGQGFSIPSNRESIAKKKAVLLDRLFFAPHPFTICVNVNSKAVAKLDEFDYSALNIDERIAIS